MSKVTKSAKVYSVFLAITGNTTSIAAFVCNDQEVTAKNIDADKFVSHVKTLHSIKTGTISRYLRLFKSFEKKASNYTPFVAQTTNIN